MIEAFIQIVIYKHTRTFIQEHIHLSVACIVCPSHLHWPHSTQEDSCAMVEATGESLHVKSHTGENHFICGVCGKAMTSKDSLKSHWLIRMGEKLVCLFCGKAFNKRCNFSVQYCVHARTRARAHTHTHTHTHTQATPLWEVLHSEFCAYHPQTLPQGLKAIRLWYMQQMVCLKTFPKYPS